jgi:hypothetical protein
VYIEPLPGKAAKHVGKEPIRRSFRQSQQDAPADIKLTFDELELDELELEREHIRSLLRCMAPTFPHPIRGQDMWTIRKAKIVRFETSFLT